MNGYYFSSTRGLYFCDTFRVDRLPDRPTFPETDMILSGESLTVCSLQVWAADPFFSNPQTWATFGDARIEEWKKLRYSR